MLISEKLKKISVTFERKKYYFIFALVFKVILEFSYVSFINPVFVYEGYSIDVDLGKFAESWIIFIVCISFSPKLMRKPSDYLLNYILFYFATPVLVYYGLADADRYHLFLIFLCIFLVFIFRSGKPVSLPVLNGGRRIAIVILLIGAFLVTAWMVYVGGLKNLNFDLTRVYEYREDSGDLINQGVMAYLVVWATKVFGPLLIALFLWQRRFALALGVILLHVI